MSGYIYITTNNINGKRYIGKAWNNKNKNYIGSGILLVKAVKKYGRENFKKEILEDNIYCKKELIKKEIYYIEKYNAYNSDLFYNLTIGGDGGETVKDKSIYKTKQFREKCSISAIKRSKNPEYLKKLSSTLKGRKISEKTKIKLKDFHKNQHNDNLKIKVKQLNDNKEIVNIFNSMIEATRYFNKSSGNSSEITKACRTGRKAWGFYWEYVNKENNINFIKKNKSIYKGVYWNTYNQKWFAIITVDKKSRYLGGFLIEENAALKYNEYIISNNIDRKINIISK